MHHCFCSFSRIVSTQDEPDPFSPNMRMKLNMFQSRIQNHLTHINVLYFIYLYLYRYISIIYVCYTTLREWKYLCLDTNINFELLIYGGKWALPIQKADNQMRKCGNKSWINNEWICPRFFGLQTRLQPKLNILCRKKLKF